MKKIILALAAIASTSLSMKAQDEVETTVEADVVSSYIWRGQDLGSMAVQPTLGVEWKGLSLTAWGSYGLSDPADTKEFDLTLGYSVGNFNVGITDYWFNSGLDAKGRYFMYDNHKTNHVFEANVGYDFGVASVQWFTNFSGNDGVNKDGDRAYSSYVEIAAPFKLGSCDWEAAVGAVPYATSFYGANGFAITNVSLKATKDIKVSDSFTLPVFAGVTANPCSQKSYFMFGFTLKK